MNELFEKDGFTISIPKDITLRNILISHGFVFIKDAHYYCADNEISTCQNEKEVFNALGEFHGNY